MSANLALLIFLNVFTGMNANVRGSIAGSCKADIKVKTSLLFPLNSELHLYCKPLDPDELPCFNDFTGMFENCLADNAAHWLLVEELLIFAVCSGVKVVKASDGIFLNAFTGILANAKGAIAFN